MSVVYIVVSRSCGCRGSNDRGGVLPEIQTMIGGVHLHELVSEEVSAKELAGGIPIRVGHGHD